MRRLERLSKVTGYIFQVCLVLAIGLAATPATAANGRGQIQVNSLDASRAPDVELYVAVEDSSGSMVQGLAGGAFRIFDNGQPISNPKVMPVDVGLQIAIVIDASGSINRPGLTGQNRMDEVRQALDDLLGRAGPMDVVGRSDWVMVGVQEQRALRLLTADSRYPQGWTNDYQFAFNQVYLYESAEQRGDTPLLEGVAEALDLMKRVPLGAGHAASQRAVIVFSDGTDVASRLQVEDVAAAANDDGVIIHSVRLGQPQAQPDAALSVERLSALARGTHVIYDGPDALSPLYKELAARRHQYRIQYRMPAAGTHAVRVQAQIDVRGRTVEGEASFSDNLEPASVTLQPASSTVERHPSETEPVLPLSLEVLWPDGRPRNLREVSFFMNGMRNSVSQPPFEPFALRLRDVIDGQHILYAEVLDEFGLRARSPDVVFQVRTLQPLSVSVISPAPGVTIARQAGLFVTDMTLAEPRGYLVEISWQAVDGHPRAAEMVEYVVDGQFRQADAEAAHLFQWDISRLPSGPHILVVRVRDEFGLVGESRPVPVNISVQSSFAPDRLSLLALTAAFTALVLVAYLFIQKREAVSSVGRRVSSKVRSVTQPWRPDGMRERKIWTGAHLLVEDGDSNYPEPIPLVAGNTRIGRDEGLVNLLFQDITVSRLHARISKEQDGSFRIYDEGSTSGTYVNYQRVPMAGQLLQANDVVQVGRVRLRFALGGERRMRPQVRTEPMQLLPDNEPRQAGDRFDTEPWHEVPHQEFLEGGYLGGNGTPPLGSNSSKTEPYLPANES